MSIARWWGVVGPRVSVLMPVRDGEKWLAPAVDSVLGQTLADFELIIVDDGSADATPALLAEYGRRDPRVRTIRMDRTGLVAALNRGLYEAAAPLVARLDADDVCMPHRLERQAGILDEHPSVVIIGSWADIIDTIGRPIGRMERPTAHPELARLLDQGNPFIHSSVMFRTDVVRDLGGYRSAFAAAEDYDLLVRVAERGEVIILPESLVQYRRHQGSVTQTQAVRQVFSVRMARRARAFRAAGAGDPAGGLVAPPDFFAPEADTAFYAEDAQLCRILALGDASLLSAANLARINMDDLRHNLPQMSRVERKLAQSAIVAILRSKISPLPEARISMLALLFRLNAGKALKLLPGLWGGGETRELASERKNSSRE